MMKIRCSLLELSSSEVFDKNAPAFPKLDARRPKLMSLISEHKSYLKLKIVTIACSKHEIANPEVALQYQGKPLGGPKSNHFQLSSHPTNTPSMKPIRQAVL